jgi:GntR family transcriptional regulator
LERFPGRGTFVKDRHNFTKFLLDRSFSQQMRELGLEPKSIILSSETSIVTNDHISALHRWKGSPSLILERLRLGNNQPICHQTSIVIIDKCPDLHKKDLSSFSLYETLSTHYHILIHRIDHIVRAVAADEYRAELLKVQKDSPLLFVGTKAYAEDGNLIEYSTSYYRADRYEFITTQACCDE